MITQANKETLKKFLTPEVKSCVNAYLMARAHAETMREAIDKIHLEILKQYPIYADKDTRSGRKGEQIFKSKDLYLCSDDNLCQFFYDEANIREREAGLKPACMADEYCPALVAESLQLKTEKMLIEVSGKHFGVTNDKLLCQKDGLEKRQQWIDLVVKLVVNQPDFVNPLTGK